MLNRIPLRMLNRIPLRMLNRIPLRMLNRIPLRMLSRIPLRMLNRIPQLLLTLYSLMNTLPTLLINRTHKPLLGSSIIQYLCYGA